MNHFSKIGVIGAGAFGTALAIAINQADRRLVLWARKPAAAMAIKERRENSARLPGIAIPTDIDVTSDPDRLADCDLALYVGPAQEFAKVLPDWHKGLAPEALLVIAAKGIDQQSGDLLTTIATRLAPERSLAVLSGPSFAKDIANGLPTALTLACADQRLGEKICQSIGSRTLRPYWSEDIVGTQVGGALKNVIAIACGIVHGKGLGESARTALMTRGLAELARLTGALDGDPKTLMGLSGIGDLSLSCNSLQSRNMSFGNALGQGRTVQDILESRSAVTEGVMTTKAVHELAIKIGLEMPITAAVHAVIHEGKPLDATIDQLLARPYKKETS